MQISSINFINYCNKVNSNSKNKDINMRKDFSEFNFMNNIPAISFYGSITRVRKPSLENEISKKIIDKFQQFPKGCRTFPNKCMFFEVNGKKYAMRIDKSSENKMLLTVKDNVKTVEDFDIPEIGRQSMYCVFDDKGFMINGELYKKMNNKFTKRFLFSAETDMKRRIKTDSSYYRPMTGQNKDLWNRLKDMSTSCPTECVNFKKEFANLDFAELFFELSKSRTTIL